MLKKPANFKGYILLESCLAFMVVTVLLLEIIPLIVSLRNAQRAGQQRLEVYRYFSELALAYQVNGEVVFKPKVSNQLRMHATGVQTPNRVTRIRLDVKAESYQIDWIGSEDASQKK